VSPADWRSSYPLLAPGTLACGHRPRSAHGSPGRGDRLAHRKEVGSEAGLPKVAPHDLRRTCARLCQSAGGELEQIQFLLGHVSIQTTERYLGGRQRLRCAVNDRIGIEPSA
jgi:integrase